MHANTQYLVAAPRLDGRTREAREVRAVIASLRHDLGTPLSALAEMQVERLGRLLVTYRDRLFSARANDLNKLEREIAQLSRKLGIEKGAR
jgi:hypothetical protein